MKKYILSCFIIIVGPFFLDLIFYNSPALAQNTNLVFEKLSQKNGLSNNVVKSIFQDKRGFMWFGSINGLNRFDGKDFVVFNHKTNDNNSISNDFINCITEDENQNLWIGTAKGLNKYSPKNRAFYNFGNNPDNQKVFSEDYITCLKIVSDRKIWIGTRNRGILRYNIELKKLTSVLLNNKPISYSINYICEDINKNIWVGTSEGLYRISLKNDLIIRTEKFLNVYVNQIYADKNDNIFIGTTAGLYTLQKNQLLTSSKSDFINYSKTNTAHSISHNDVTAIYEDKDGQLWVGTDGGGLNISRTAKDLIFSNYQNIPNNSNSLSQNQVFAITQDFSGVVWIATNDGINKLKKFNHQFIHFQSNPLKINSLESNNLAAIRPIILNGKEYLICGSAGGTGLGLISSNDVHQNNENFIRFEDDESSLNSRKYQSFLILGSNSLLIGTKSGIRLFDLRTKKFIPINNSLKKITKHVIRKIHKDDNGLVWIGTNNGLYLWNSVTDSLTKAPLENNVIEDNDYKSFVERSSLSNIFSITEDNNNNIWVGTWGGGLLKFNANYPQRKPIRFTANDSATSLASNYIVSLLYSDSKLWIGSTNGLSCLTKPETSNTSTSFKNIQLSQNANKIHVAGILEDQRKNLWIATINGLIKYNTENQEVTSYEVTSGDLTKENYKTGLAKDAKGYLYFGGINGLVSFHPDSILTDQNQYPIVLTDFRIFKKNQIEQIDNTSIYFKDKITLSPKEYSFSFSFSQLNYKISDEINYAYMLEGIDKTWIYTKSDQRFATYSNLSPGNYVLKVKATNENNVWSAPKKLLNITILTPWWLSWWAYSIYLLILFTLVYAIVKYVLEKERLQNNLALERLEKQRVKEVDELKFKYFTNISHEFRTPLTLILGPLEQLYQQFPNFNNNVKSNLKQIQHNVSHLLRLINQLMDFRKMEEGNLKLSVSENNLSAFIKEVIENFDLLAQKKKISLALKSPQEFSEKLWFDLDKLEKILNNVIHNALSFTPINGKIILDISLSADAETEILKIAVIDSGKGINHEELQHIFEHFYQANNQTRSFTQGYGIGLSLTKELIKIHRGKIEVDSDGINGSTFTIELPVSKKSYTEDERTNESVINLQHPFNFQGLDEDIIEANEKNIFDKNDKPTLLIVDDNPEIRKYLLTCFYTEYKIIEAENGEEGIKKANTCAPDLIISDVMMPIMDGMEFCKTIKTNITTSHIPVILLTALSSKEHLIEGLETGADIYLTKPFYIDVLKLNVRNLLEARKKLRERFAYTDIMEPSEVTVNSVDERFLKKVMSIIEKNLSNSEYDIEDFVEEMGMGRSAFYRKLKQVSGQSPNEFIRIVRLKRAAQLIKKQTGTISEISYETGFIDPAYFTRCFKKQFGVTPSEFNASIKSTELY